MDLHSQTPLRIGVYEIGKNLGVGSFGKVKLGIHIPTGAKKRRGHRATRP